MYFHNYCIARKNCGNKYVSICYSGVRVRHGTPSSTLHHQPLPAVPEFLLFVDDITSAGADDACRLILALTPADKRSEIAEP